MACIRFQARAGAGGDFFGFGRRESAPMDCNSAGFDLTNEHMFISYAAGSDPIATIRGYLVSGYNSGAWNGLGIDSSTAAANAGYGLGYADSADSGNPANVSKQ